MPSAVKIASFISKEVKTVQFESGEPKMKNEKTLGSIAISEVNTALEPMWRSVIPLFTAYLGRGV
jgi:hypothetical protein